MSLTITKPAPGDSFFIPYSFGVVKMVVSISSVVDYRIIFHGMTAVGFHCQYK